MTLCARVLLPDLLDREKQIAASAQCIGGTQEIISIYNTMALIADYLQNIHREIGFDGLP